MLTSNGVRNNRVAIGIATINSGTQAKAPRQPKFTTCWRQAASQPAKEKRPATKSLSPLKATRTWRPSKARTTHTSTRRAQTINGWVVKRVTTLSTDTKGIAACANKKVVTRRNSGVSSQVATRSNEATKLNPARPTHRTDIRFNFRACIFSSFSTYCPPLYHPPKKGGRSGGHRLGEHKKAPRRKHDFLPGAYYLSEC